MIKTHAHFNVVELLKAPQKFHVSLAYCEKCGNQYDSYVLYQGTRIA